MPNYTSLNKYVALRVQLLGEKSDIETRLAKINAALGTAPAKVVAARGSSKPRKQGRRRRNKLSLKSAALQVTSAKPLTKQEIIEAVQEIGYTFATKNPANSLGVVLYSGKTFKNQNGKFSPAK